MLRKFGNDISGIDNRIIGLDSGMGLIESMYTNAIDIDSIKQPDWIDISINTPSNGISYLVNDTRDAAYGFLAMTSTGSQYQVDWGDGYVLTYDSGTTATHAYTTVGQVCSKGYSTFKVIITPVSGDLLSCKIGNNGTGFTTQYHGVLWCYVKTNTLIDMSYMFYNASGYYCFQLEVFEVFDIDTTINVTTMNSMFGNCRRLTTVPLFNTINVTNMTNMFTNCYVLTTVPLFNTVNVIDMNSMFGNCRRLTTVPLFNTINVTNMTNMFTNCYVLTTVPLFNTVNVIDMNSMFGSCYVLTTVPLFNTINVTNMTNMFNYCYRLTTVHLFNTINVTNMTNMFTSCYVLTTVPLFNTINVTNMTNMFNSCYALTTVPLFNTINVTNMSSMFSSCYVLPTVPLFNTINVTTMSSMFTNCFALTTVPLLNTVNVTTMNSMFNSCYALMEFTVNGGIFSGTSPQIGIANSGLSYMNINKLFNSLPSNILKTISIVGAVGNVIKSLSGTSVLNSNTITMSSTDGLTEGMEIRGTGISSSVSVTFTDTTNVITKTGHGLQNGKLVYFPTILTTIGITINTPYYVINKTTDAFQISITPNGQPLSITTGTGTMAYSTIITSIQPNVSVTIDVPASASSTITTKSSKMYLSLAIGKGWSVTT